MDSLLEVGQIVNSYGIKGFLKVVPLVDSIEQFKTFKKLYIQNKEELEIEEIKFSKNLVLVKVKGIDTIEDALRYKNLYLYAKREDIKLEDGAHFIVDLIGLEVYTDDGRLLGILKEVLQPGANDVYIVESEDKKQILLPVIPDVVKDINIEKRKIIVHLLEGLI